jgi:transposase
MIGGLKTQPGAIDTDRDGAGRASSVWRETEGLRRSVPGVGRVVAATRLAAQPALGRKTIAARVGAAPFHRDRGVWRGRRAI